MTGPTCIAGVISVLPGRLIAAKAEVAHGEWLPWLKEEFGWSEETARNFMQVAEAFKSATLADFSGLTIDATAPYAQAAADVPQEALKKEGAIGDAAPAAARAKESRPLTCEGWGRQSWFAVAPAIIKLPPPRYAPPRFDASSRLPDLRTYAPHRLRLCRVMRNQKRQFGRKSSAGGSRRSFVTYPARRAVNSGGSALFSLVHYRFARAACGWLLREGCGFPRATAHFQPSRTIVRTGRLLAPSMPVNKLRIATDRGPA